MRKQLRLGNGVLAHHLHALERQRHIRRRQTGMHVRFYPMALRPPPDISLDPTASRILRVVQQRPGVSQSDAGRGLGLSRQLVHHHVRRLEEWGLLSVVREGRSSHLRPTQAVTGLRRCPSCQTDHVWKDVPAQATCPSCQRPFQPRADRSTLAT